MSDDEVSHVSQSFAHLQKIIALICFHRLRFLSLYAKILCEMPQDDLRKVITTQNTKKRKRYTNYKQTYKDIKTNISAKS